MIDYDTLDRLVQSDYLVGILTEDEQFTYDDLGNRITLNNRAGNDVVYAHNVANEYTSIGGTNVSHDAAGNLSADPNGYTYEYDNDNRLTKIKKDSGTTTVAEFTYDALGRRIEAIDSIAATTTRYYYDGWRVLSETNAAGTKQRHYVYGNYLDEALMLIHDDGEASPTYTDYYYAHNHLYSPTALINASGTVVERYEYDAYGKQYVMEEDYDPRDSSSYDNVIAFTGQRLDSLDSGDLQLMYYKNRYHCTNTGRFLQRDPVGYFDGLNLYEYVKSNPSNKIDEYGWACGDCQPPMGRPNFHSTRVINVGYTTGKVGPGAVKALLSGVDNFMKLIGATGKIPDPIPTPPLGDLETTGEGYKVAKKLLSNLMNNLGKDGLYLWISVEYKSCDYCRRSLNVTSWRVFLCKLYEKRTHQKWHPCSVPGILDQSGTGQIYSNAYTLRGKEIEVWQQFNAAYKDCQSRAMRDPVNPPILDDIVK